jgi:hypothetical protein
MAEQLSPQQANILARNMIVGGAVKRTQQIFSSTIDINATNVLNVAPRNVGLILGFIVQLEAVVGVEAGGSPLTKTPFGPYNLLKNVSYFDLQNNTRINTTGWHLGLMNSARSGAPYLAARANVGMPVDFGNFHPSLGAAPNAIAADAEARIAQSFYVPLAYSDEDLRGSVYANVVNATQNLQLTLNNALVQARTLAATTDAAYVTATAGTPLADVSVTQFKVKVYQVYYDQLPQGQSGIILPALDISTIYELKQTAIPGVTAGQDFPLPYSNFRDFLSTVAIYRNRPGVSPSTGFALESDIASVALESANYTNIFKVNPDIAAAWGRQTIGDDFPLGVFYIPSRSKPVSTVQYGNMNLVFNANDVQPGGTFLVGYEAFALTNIIGSAQGLPPA